MYRCIEIHSIFPCKVRELELKLRRSTHEQAERKLAVIQAEKEKIRETRAK